MEERHLALVCKRMRSFGAAALPVFFFAAWQCASGFQASPRQMSLVPALSLPGRASRTSATGACTTGGGWNGRGLQAAGISFAPRSHIVVHSLCGARGRAKSGPWITAQADGGSDPRAKSGHASRAKRALQDLITQVRISPTCQVSCALLPCRHACLVRLLSRDPHPFFQSRFWPFPPDQLHRINQS